MTSIRPSQRKPVQVRKPEEEKKTREQEAQQKTAAAGAAAGVGASTSSTTTNPVTPSQQSNAPTTPPKGAGAVAKGDFTADGLTKQRTMDAALTAPQSTRAVPDIAAALSSSSVAPTNTSPAAEEQIRQELRTDPQKGLETMKTHLANLPDDAARQQATENLKNDVATAVAEKAKTDKVAAARLLQQAVEAAPDAASKKALIEANKDTIRDIAQTYSKPDAQGMQPAQEAMEVLARTGVSAGPDGLKAMTDAMASGITNPNAFSSSAFKTPMDAALRDLAKKDPELAAQFTSSLSQSLEPVNPTASVEVARVNGDTVGNLMNANRELTAARARVQDLNKKLNEGLAALGPGLTNKQKQDYINKFYEKYKADYDKEAAAGQKVAQALKLLEASAPTPATTRLALDSAKQLADSPGTAHLAKDFAERLANNPNSPLAKALNSTPEGQEELKKGLNDVVAKAIPNMMTKNLSDAGGNPDAALAKLQEQLATLNQGEAAKTFGENIPAALKGMEALRRGDYKALESIDKLGNYGNALKAAGVVIAVARLGSGANDPASAAYLKDLANAGKDGADLLAAGMRSIGRMAMFKTSGGLATATKFMEKMAPGLGVIANALSAYINVNKARSPDGNWADYGAALGDAAATVGCALAVTGVGAAPGAVLQVGGALISTVGGLVSDGINASKNREEQKELLKKIGMDDQMIERLTSTDPAVLKQMEEKLKMSPEQVQDLLRRHPEVLTTPGHTQAFVDAAYSVGLEGDGVNGLADKMQQDDPNYAGRLVDLKTASQNQSESSREAVLRNNLLQPPFNSTAEYIRSTNPELFSEATQQEIRADQRYDNRGGGSDPHVTKANMLKRETNPDYQARIIERMKQDGSLESWAESMGTNNKYNGWPEAAKQAILNARDKGKLTPEEADRLIQKIGV